MEKSISGVDKIIADKMVDILFPESLLGMIARCKDITDAAFYILAKERVRQEPSFDRDANLLYQMAILKCHSILKLAEGFNNYVIPIESIAFSPLFDSFSISSIVRPQYESFCNFNNIFLQSKNKHELSLKYDLWVLSGLNYRQSFNAKSEENKQKQKDEKEQIEKIMEAIRSRF